MLGMTIGTGGSVTMAHGQGFSMHALGDVPGGLLMADAARFRQPGKMHRGIGRRRRQHGMPVVAITASGGFLLPPGGGNAMDASAVTLGLLGVAFGAIDDLSGKVIVGVL